MAENKFVVFKLGSERYGLPISSVERILPVMPLTRIPRTPKMMLGVFELRGSTIPAIDARLRFDLPADCDARNFVVVLTSHGRFALRVDRVDGIQSFPVDQIEDGMELLSAKNDEMIAGVGKLDDSLTVLLDPEQIIPDQLRQKLAA